MATMTMPQLEAAIKGVGDQLPQLIAQGMTDAAIVMVRDIRAKHLSGPKMPRGKTGGFDRSTLLSITGMKNRVAYKVETTGKTAQGWVGMNLTNKGYPYPRAHEYGEGKMPERPWLRPAVFSNQEYLLERIVQRILDGYGRLFT